MVIHTWYLAIGTGADILQENANVATQTASNWNALAKSVFDIDSGIWQAVIYVAKQMTQWTFLGFSTALILQIVHRQYMGGFKHFLWILLAMMLLYDNGAPIAAFNLGWKELTVEQTENIYSTQIAGVATEEAIKDVLITGEIKRSIENKKRACEAKSGDQAAECLLEVGKYAERAIADAEAQWGNLAGLARLGKRMNGITFDLIDLINDPNATQLDYANVESRFYTIFLGSGLQSVVHWFSKTCQWLFVNGIELSLILTGLYGPIAVALTTLPLPTRFLWAWLLGNLVLSGTLWSYAIMVGVLAQFIAMTGIQDQADLDFLLFMGVFAPIASLTFVRGAGTAMWHSMTAMVAFFGRLIV